MKKLPGAPGGRYAAKDADGKLKDITTEGTVFDRAPSADPWLEIAEISSAQAEQLAAAALHASGTTELVAECESILSRLEAKHGALPPAKRPRVLSRLIEDEEYRVDAMAELDAEAEKAEAEKAEAEKAAAEKKAAKEKAAAEKKAAKEKAKKGSRKARA